MLGFDGLLGVNLSRRLTVLGSGYKGRPHKGEDSGSKTHPCDNWYQSVVALRRLVVKAVLRGLVLKLRWGVAVVGKILVRFVNFDGWVKRKQDGFCWVQGCST